MKVKVMSLFAVLTLALTLAFSAAAPAAPNATNGKPVPAAAAKATPEEPHPEIREAIRSLRAAKQHMEHAAHDFGGHRVEALKATDEAIHQLEVCLKYDKD
ncbi:MAG: hypothetical protein WBC04_13660 [Candidatus Acidiferrales bacterium]|jgi:hypothetical protein